MASADVKLPLAVKKEIRDKEAGKTAALAPLTALVGAPVTFNWSVEQNWKALEGDGSQANLVSAVVEQYLPAVIYALTRELKDELVKEKFLSLWTTKNITFTIEKQDYKEPEKNVHVWGGYNGLRLKDGALDIYLWPSTFWTNVGHVENFKFSDLLKNAAGDLPLAIKQQIRDTQAQRDAACERIAKAVGVDKVTWNINSDAANIIKRGDKDYEFDVSPAIQYIEALAYVLEKKCADEMVKEAVADVFKNKVVGVKVVDDLSKVSGLKIHSSYNGIQFDEGGIYVITVPNYWWCNVSQVENFDIISLF
jgi:hypothetical protein